MVKAYVDELSQSFLIRVTKWTERKMFSTHTAWMNNLEGWTAGLVASGGTLIIDRTEAMTVIDVNTGKFIGCGRNFGRDGRVAK